MKYIVELNGDRHEVELDGSLARVGDLEVDVDLSPLEGTPIRLVKIGNEIHRVIARRGDTRGRYTLSVDGFRFQAEALDERARAIRDITASAAKASGPAPIVAPMPGLIVRVNVKVGDVIEAGHGAVVMEAMKMENELRAPAGGRVKAVHAEAGTAAEKGAILVELE
jgi:pyruvate carboxylase subunit B